MTGAVDQPASEVDVTEELVRALLAEQHPDLADQPLVEIAAGWDNVIFRLGADLSVRLPRRELAAPLVAHEQRWLGELAPLLPLPIPAPVRIGRPGRGFPWSWSVTRWFSGRPAIASPPDDPERAAVALGEFVAALHQPAPVDAPPNPYRGIPLADRHDRTVDWIDALSSMLDADEVRRCWDHHVALPRWDGPACWLHGDLHPANVIVDAGEMAAIIDFGDITAGDPATDLGIAWMLLPPDARPAFRQATGVDDLTWERGRGWALTLGVAYLANSASTPDFAALGRSTIDEVLRDPDR